MRQCVISPLLANLFLHYAFDKWFEKTYPDFCFERYADDIIVHCNSQVEADEVLIAIKKRLGECKLELNEKKTRIVYCMKDHRKDKFKTVQFDFPGFSFQPRPATNHGKELFLSYDCAISRKSENKIVEVFRNLRFRHWISYDLSRIALVLNPKIRGWINYFGKFRMHKLSRIFTILNERLVRWAVNKYRRFGHSFAKAGRWLSNLAVCYPGLFVHWQYGFQFT